MAIYTYVGLYRDYNANNNFESVAVVNVAKDGYSSKGKYNIETLNAHLGIDQLHDTSIFGHGKLECPPTIKGGGTGCGFLQCSAGAKGTTLGDKR